MTIKTCPHCDGTASLYANFNHRAKSYFVFVKCDICGAQGKIYNNKENPQQVNWDSQACKDAICAWNMRKGAIDAE